MDLIIGLQRGRVTCCVLCILWVVCTKGASYQGFRGMPIHPKAILYLLVSMTRPQFKKKIQIIVQKIVRRRWTHNFLAAK